MIQDARTNSMQRGLLEGDTRYTIVMPIDRVELLRDIAYTRRITMKQLFSEMTDAYLATIDESDVLARPGSKREEQHVQVR